MSGSGRTIPIGAAELRAIRERESVLEQTLARLTGIDMTTIERIENGETPLTTLEPDQIRQWAKTLGVNPARLTGETPQEGEGGTTVIRRMRTERGWSCPQLAAHANVPYRSLRQYDSGERDTANMAAGILARVAIALDTSMEKLAGRPEPDHATDDPPAGWTGTRLAWHRTPRLAPDATRSQPGRTRHPGRTDHADHRRHRDPPVGHRQQTQPHHPRPRRRPRRPGARPHGPNTGRETTHGRTPARENGTFGRGRRPRLPQPRERGHRPAQTRRPDHRHRRTDPTAHRGPDRHRQRHRTARPIRLGRQAAPAKEMNGGPTKTIREKTRRRGEPSTALPASLFYGHPVHAERRGMNILPDRSMWRNP